MDFFGDRLVTAIDRAQTPCVVGLDPRPDMFPDFASRGQDVGGSIMTFNELVIAAVADLVPAVKLQVAFYERFGVDGMSAFARSIKIARDHGLIVLVDAKRNDISSTAEAYADAFLSPSGGFAVDAITVSPFLGRDSLLPFVKACERYGRGVFVLVKTSNPGSVDIQDCVVRDGRPLYEHLADMVTDLASSTIGESGYSAIGAVVGATFPAEACALRKRLRHSIILVPGYGTQGGTAESVVHNFDAAGRGAIVNASRSVTYHTAGLSASEYSERVRLSTRRMIADVSSALSHARTRA